MDLKEAVSTDSTGFFTNESVTTITVGVVDEEREQDRIKLNLIFHNVSETTKQRSRKKSRCHKYDQWLIAQFKKNLSFGTTATNRETAKILRMLKNIFLRQDIQDKLNKWSRANAADHHLVSVCVLVDSGSQHSYITDSLKVKVNLKTLCQERLSLNMFCSTACKRENCNIIRVVLLSKQGEDVVIQALTFPAICSPLQKDAVVDEYPHFQSLDLANETNDEYSPNTIDILIGSDFTGV